MRPSSNKTAKLYGTAKTHKFADVNSTTVEDLKLRPIIDQTGTAYNAAKVLVEYLKPLTTNRFTIKDTQTFATMMKDLPPLQTTEE